MPGVNGPDWHQGNNRYLSASLQWLRLRLERMIPSPPPATSERRAWLLRRRLRAARPLTLPAPNARSDSSLNEMVA